MAEIKVGDKVRLTQDVSYSNHKKGDIGVVTRTSEGLTSLIRVRMEYNNTNGDTAPFEPYEIELVEDLETKVGDYFTNTDKDIVWKVTGFPSRDEVKTKALMVTDGLDFAETVTLSREVVLSLDGATPEQIEAFENHPYWGKQEPIADAISPSVYQFPNGVEVRSVSSTGAEKGVKSSRFSLLPMEALTEVASHYGVGATKYKDHNMRRGYEWSKSYDALMRHATQFWSGEDNDEETGSKHLAAVVFHALTLMEFMETHPEFDDRYKLSK